MATVGFSFVFFLKNNKGVLILMVREEEEFVKVDDIIGKSGFECSRDD